MTNNPQDALRIAIEALEHYTSASTTDTKPDARDGDTIDDGAIARDALAAIADLAQPAQASAAVPVVFVERANRIIKQFDESTAKDMALMNFGGCAIELLRDFLDWLPTPPAAEQSTEPPLAPGELRVTDCTIIDHVPAGIFVRAGDAQPVVKDSLTTEAPRQQEQQKFSEALDKSIDAYSQPQYSQSELDGRRALGNYGNVKMTKEEFIDQYCAASNKSWAELSETLIPLPCACHDQSCQGWAMVSTSPGMAKIHEQLYAPRGKT